MTTELKVPVLPESVADAVIATWHKKPGDTIHREENLVDLETDKVVLEVPAPFDGILKEIKIEAGETVVSDEILGIIEEMAVSSDPEPAETTTAPSEPTTATETTKAEPQTSPAVRKLLDENKLSASDITGSGKNGRLLKEDVEKHLAAKPETSPTDTIPSGSRVEERVPMTRLRSRIAERMVEAQESTVMLTSSNEVDLSAVMEIRSKYKDAFLKQHNVKLGFMSFFVKAASEALRKHPVVNASVDGSDIIYHAYQDVGIAVATERGLVVPVLKNAGDMSLAEIETSIFNYAQKARKGGLQLEDLQGGTFTITNGGVFGSLFSTPIINPPQSAILGMHTIKQRAVVVDGEVVARPMMYIALTYDHRIIDGKDAVLFLVAIKDALEDPSRLLLGL
ncbi:MAG: 2-oxoglutarate dehydrogenase complex dihydrolipoyllysine-residue succinyltransferase [bacterium]